MSFDRLPELSFQLAMLQLRIIITYEIWLDASCEELNLPCKAYYRIVSRRDRHLDNNRGGAVTSARHDVPPVTLLSSFFLLFTRKRKDKTKTLVA